MVDERTRNRRAWLLFGLALLTLVLLFCMCTDSRMIESDLRARAQAGLDGVGLDPELVRVAGRDVRLEGVVDSSEARLAAGAAVAALPGVRLLSNNLSVDEVSAPTDTLEDIGVGADVSDAPVPASGEARLLLELSESTPVLSGAVDEATADLANATLSSLAAAETQDGSAAQDVQALDLQTAEAATPQWFRDVVEMAPDYAAQVQEGSLDLSPERLTLRGVVPSDEVRSELGESFAAAAGETVNIVNELRVEAIQEAGELTFTLDESPSGLSLSGAVSEPAATVLSSALTPLGVQNRLTLDDTVETPEWLGNVANLTPDFVDSVDEARLSVTLSSITLEGTALDEAARTAQVEAFSAAADAEIINNLEILEAQEEPQAPSLRLLESGENITLSGTLAPTTNAQTEQIAQDFSGDVSNELDIAENVSVPDWLSSLVEYLPTYSDNVQDAELELNDDALRLAGNVASQGERDELEASVRERIGDDVTLNNELIVAQSEPANFRLESSAAGTRLSGTLPPSAASLLVDTLTPVTDEIRDDLSVSAVDAPEWLPGLIEGLPSYTGEAQDAALELEGETLTLSGTVESEDQKQALGERISELSGGEAEIINNLNVETGAEETPEAETEEPADAAQEEAADEEADVEPDVEAAAPEATEPEATDVEAVEPDPTEEPEAAESEAAEPDSVEPEAAQSQPTDEQAADSVEASELPEAQTLTSEPELRVDVLDNTVSLTGTVANDAIKNAAAQGYSVTVDNALELSEVSSPDYLTPILEFGPEFAGDVSRGSLNLSSDTLTLQGFVADEATRTALGDAAISAAGPDINVVNRLSLASSIPPNEDGK